MFDLITDTVAARRLSSPRPCVFLPANSLLREVLFIGVASKQYRTLFLCVRLQGEAQLTDLLCLCHKREQKRRDDQTKQPDRSLGTETLFLLKFFAGF